MSEEWKLVPSYEQFYEASDQGRLRRIATHKGAPKCRIVTPHKKAHGYQDYWLWSEGTCKRVSAHRLIWEAFNGPIQAGMVINHKNGDKIDNRLCNLEVVTPSENTAHAFRVLGRKPPNNPSFGEKNGSSVLTEDKVRAIRSLYQTGLTQYQVADAFGVCQRTVNLVVRRKTWAHVI